MPRRTGESLNRNWKIGAKQARFAQDGMFYMPLDKFPGALCDPYGYVLFATEEDYIQCQQLRHPGSEVENQRLNVESPGISNILGYVKIE